MSPFPGHGVTETFLFKLRNNTTKEWLLTFNAFMSQLSSQSCVITFVSSWIWLFMGWKCSLFLNMACFWSNNKHSLKKRFRLGYHPSCICFRYEMAQAVILPAFIRLAWNVCVERWKDSLCYSRLFMILLWPLCGVLSPCMSALKIFGRCIVF